MNTERKIPAMIKPAIPKEKLEKRQKSGKILKNYKNTFPCFDLVELGNILVFNILTFL